MKNTSYLDMIAGRKPDHIPVWFMRQAGRSQAKYREIKRSIPYLKLHINQNYVPILRLCL